MFFNTKGLGGLSHPVRVHRTSFLHKALWAIGISFFAAIACLASGSLIMSTFIVAFAAISWHFIVRDEKAAQFACFDAPRANGIVRGAGWDFSGSNQHGDDPDAPRYEFRPRGYDLGGDEHGDFDFTGAWKQR